MAYSSTEELLDDNNKLESKVVLALSRLGRLKKKPARSNGVSCKQIVRYLISNYSNLDGDIESQVMTALLSCIKTGIVCVLDNGKYILSGPSSKSIIAKCFARGSHGPNCACASAIKRISGSSQKTCCHLQSLTGSTKTTKGNTKSEQKGTTKGEQKGTTKPRTTAKSKKSKKPAKEKWGSCKCAQLAQEMLDSGGMVLGGKMPSRCNFCMELHFGRTKTSARLCRTCYSLATGFIAPYNKFSPREELT